MWLLTLQITQYQLFFLSPPINLLFILIYSKYALSQNKKEKVEL